jgi:O-acetyl-ADP-ribose deacetylase (regulator of RNase III)
MIRVVLGVLHEQETEGILRPIRSDLDPATAASRDVSEAAGASMNDKFEQVGSIPLGGAIITPAGDLTADFVIHAVVSSPDEPESPSSVQKALRNSLRRAVDLGLESLALPPLGAGAGQLDAEGCALAMLEVVFFHLDEGQPPQDVRIIVGSEYEQSVFDELVRGMADQRSVGG